MMANNSLWDAWEKANQYQSGTDENTGAATYSLRPEYFTGSGRPQMQNAGYFSNIDEILADPYYQQLGLTRDMIQSDGQGGFMVPTALSDKREISLNELAKQNAKGDIFDMAPLAFMGLGGGAALGGAFGTMGGVEGLGAGAGGFAVDHPYWSMLAEGGGAATDAAAAGAGTFQNSLTSLLPNLSTPEGFAQFLAKQGLSTGIGSLLSSGGGGNGVDTAGGTGMNLSDWLSSQGYDFSGTDFPGVGVDATGGGVGDSWDSFGTDETQSGLGVDEIPGGGGSSPLLDWLKKVPTSAWSQILGSGIQGLGSLLASRTQQNAGNQAMQLLRETNAQNRADTQPYRDAAIPALGNLRNMTTPGYDASALMTDPGAAYRQKMGQQELDNRLRSGGKFYSGSALKAGQDFNQGIASQEFGNAFNRNATLAGIGQTATNNTTNLNATTGNNLAGIEQGIGNVRASGYQGIGNAVQGGLNAYNQNQYQNTLLSLLPQLIGKV